MTTGPEPVTTEPLASEAAPAPSPARAAFLARLDAAKHAADVAETAFRSEAARRIEALASERAYAWRRADLMASLDAAVGGTDTAEMAAAAGQAMLRARLGWTTDSEARSEVLTRFAAVALALHAADAGGDPGAALAGFEAWYLETRQSAFWYLFEHYLPDTPLVDF
ncbi:hypothetical protein K9U40_12190 [Xanthobacter autotrophicus]|uniref:hypothetical protein n=1 Tax=Xanthobacter TaxID=279 RepID=UPI0024AB8393|nr:hypothetical protein [Xanthobacter autotrophicus]MDI4665081.1 hypothetical protein [Xanthobacter autotrophicus]